MDFTPPRGTADWLPPGSERLRAVYDLAHGVAGRFGYRYVETPTFEDTALFARSSGGTSDVVSKEMYTFADRDENRSLTLRPADARAQNVIGPSRRSYYVAHDANSTRSASPRQPSERHEARTTARISHMRDCVGDRLRLPGRRCGGATTLDRR